MRKRDVGYLIIEIIFIVLAAIMGYFVGSLS